MLSDDYAYGNWIIVVSLIALALFFITKYIPLRTRFEKRTGGVLLAFFTALFAEMYGIPLTIYLLSSFFGVQIPFTHQYGHLLAYAFTFIGIPILYGWIFVMAVSTIMLLIGIGLIIKGWKAVYHAKGSMVTTGIYAKIRHPQYTGIFIIITAFIIQWPTLITLIMYPFLVVMYYRLALREEKEVMLRFPARYSAYQRKTPMFFPSLLKQKIRRRLPNAKA